MPEAHIQMDSFFVFSCLDGVSKSDTEFIDSGIIRDHLEEVGNWLRHMTSFGDIKAYKACGLSSRPSARRFLEEKGRELEELEGNLKSVKREGDDYKERTGNSSAKSTFPMQRTPYSNA